jgi:hypothetical protein
MAFEKLQTIVITAIPSRDPHDGRNHPNNGPQIVTDRLNMDHFRFTDQLLGKRPIQRIARSPQVGECQSAGPQKAVSASITLRGC